MESSPFFWWEEDNGRRKPFEEKDTFLTSGVKIACSTSFHMLTPEVIANVSFTSVAKGEPNRLQAVYWRDERKWAPINRQLVTGSSSSSFISSKSCTQTQNKEIWERYPTSVSLRQTSTFPFLWFVFLFTIKAREDEDRNQPRELVSTVGSLLSSPVLSLLYTN